jgi:excisionase family DNA binding protein
MTPRPRRHHEKPGPADVPRRIPDPASADDDITTAASQAGQDPHGGRLACSVDEAARLTGLSRDLLYDQMRIGNLAYLKVGRRRLITRQHLEQFLDIASGAGRPGGITVGGYGTGPDAP